MKTNKWEIWGWSILCRKFTALHFGATKKECERILNTWRQNGFHHPALVQKRR